MKTLWSLSDYSYIPLPVETEISDVTLQSDSYLDGYLPSQICYEILVNFCGELFHSIMQASVLPSNTIASDWMGLSWKGLLV